MFGWEPEETGRLLLLLEDEDQLTLFASWHGVMDCRPWAAVRSARADPLMAIVLPRRADHAGITIRMLMRTRPVAVLALGRCRLAESKDGGFHLPDHVLTPDGAMHAPSEILHHALAVSLQDLHQTHASGLLPMAAAGSAARVIAAGSELGVPSAALFLIEDAAGGESEDRSDRLDLPSRRIHLRAGIEALMQLSWSIVR